MAFNNRGNRSRHGMAALGYAAKGWHVIPLHHPVAGKCSCGKSNCKSPAKHPRTPNGLKDATTDPGIIRGWWRTWPEGNIGVVTGQISGIVVVDIDVKAADGFIAWYDLLDVHGRVDTLETFTGSGGQHLIFEASSEKLRSRTGTFGPGVDTPAEGGYIVAPPSLHISEERYEWSNKVPPGRIPEWILELWPRIDPVSPDFHRVTPQKDTAVSLLDGPLPEGQRNDSLTRVAGWLKLYHPPSAVEALLLAINDARCVPPLDVAEVQAIVMSVSRYPQPGVNGHPTSCRSQV